MPQLSAIRNLSVDQPTGESFLSEITSALLDLRRELDQEICDALIREDVALAERLVLPLSRTDKLIAYIEGHRVALSDP